MEDVGLGPSAVQILPWREPTLKCWCCVGAGDTSEVLFCQGVSHHPSANVGGVWGWLHDLAQTCMLQETALGSRERGNVCRRKLVLDGDMSPVLSRHPTALMLGEEGS